MIETVLVTRQARGARVALPNVANIAFNKLPRWQGMMWQVTDAEVVTKLGYSLNEFEEAVATEVSGASLAATLGRLDDIYNLMITSTTSPVPRDVLIDYVERRDFRNFNAALILDDSTKWTVYSRDMNELSALISEMARLYQ